MSEIKVNKISPRTNCGTTTLGDSGDTFTIPAGVTITNNGTANGFGATGSVNWQTTVKTSTFTAVAGEGYFVNTTSGAITVNLPAGTAGAIVGIKDYAGTFDSNNVTVSPNGSDKIAGVNTSDGTLSTEGLAVSFVFVDSTQGWLVTDSGLQSDMPTAQYVTATGGTITTSGNFKIHTFTSPGTFCVSCAGNLSGSNTVDYLVVAGGGGGGSYYGAGAGGGGARMSSGAASGCYTVGPLGSGVAALPVTATGYPVTVGAGGANGGSPAPGGPNGTYGSNGSNSTFAGSTTITSAGGGRGAGACGAANDGGPGGSGGGGAAPPGNSASGGTGNTPPVSPPQGTNGGGASPGSGASGGGATQAGTGCSPGFGGNGINNMINPATGHIVSCVSYYAGGGNSSARSKSDNAPLGGGGGGSEPTSNGAGTANTGGGGGGNSTGSGQTGGSGIVIIRYKFQN